MDLIVNTIRVLVIVGFTAFPAWVAYVVYRRGLRTWAIGTVLSIPVFLGLFVGVLALYQTQDVAGRPLDKPCPDCGRQEGSTIQATIDRKTGAWMRILPAVVSGVLGLAAIVFGVGMAINVWVGGDEGIIRWQYGSLIAGAAFLAIGLSAGAWLGRPARRFLATDRVRVPRSKCKGCGHVWIDSAEVALPPSVPGVRWVHSSDEYLLGWNSEKSGYFIARRAEVSAPVYTYSSTENIAAETQFRALAGTWWPAVPGPASVDADPVADTQRGLQPRTGGITTQEPAAPYVQISR